MSQFKVSFAIVLLLVGTTFSKNIDNFVWYPTDNGDGYVPAFLHETPKSLIAPAANPDNIRFYLYTLNNKDTPDEISNTTEVLNNSHWDKNAPVKVMAHGFSSSYTGGSASAIHEGYMTGSTSNINLIQVDWKSLAAAPWYDVAAVGTKLVGQKSAYLLSFLVANGYTTADKIHFAGHSLGAHVAGFAGADFQKLNNGAKIARITGLDPALPRFGAANDDGRIDKTDASFVDVIHTASGTLGDGELGFLEPRGHADFYPNEGRNQPGCFEIVGECSHSRCYQYFAESIASDSFTACKCNDNAWGNDNDDEFSSASCDCAKGSAKMGEWVSHSTQGVFYLTTNRRAPWALG